MLLTSWHVMIIKVNAIEKVQCSKVQRDTKIHRPWQTYMSPYMKKFDVQKVQCDTWIQKSNISICHTVYDLKFFLSMK